MIAAVALAAGLLLFGHQSSGDLSSAGSFPWVALSTARAADPVDDTTSQEIASYSPSVPTHARDLIELTESCEAGSGTRCDLYLAGVIGGALASSSLAGGNPPFCLPEAAGSVEVLDDFIGFLAAHPSLSEVSAAGALIIHLNQSFPCR